MKKNIYIGFIILGLAILVIYLLQDRDSLVSLPQTEYTSAQTSGLSNASATEVVELANGDSYTLTASYVKKNINGKEYKMLAYNNSIPGPLLKIPQGAGLTVHFQNNLDMPTLLHSHGVRMDNAFDGAQTSQKEILPGESFSYELKFPDVGMYWYHPHVREDFQQELGLYGNFLVVPSNADYWSPVNQEVALFLDDILIENGSIPLSKGKTDRTLMGRFGNVMLVNGETDYSLSVKKDEVLRLYLTNAANTRPFNFSISGIQMKLVGGDSGAYEKDQWVDSVMLGPSERAIVEVLFDTSKTFEIQNKTLNKTYTLGHVNVSSDSATTSYASVFNEEKTHSETIKSIESFRKYFDIAPSKHLALTIDMGKNMMSMSGMGHGKHVMSNGAMMGGSMMDASPDGVEWEDDNSTMNQMTDTDSIKWKIVDQDTGFENMDIDWSFTRGEPVKIRIFNDPNSMHPMQHPMHFHGQRFLVLDRNGKKETNLVWKDTVFIPSGETIDILLDTSNPGRWMAHCHIAEHLEAGMMMSFIVK